MVAIWLFQVLWQTPFFFILGFFICYGIIKMTHVINKYCWCDLYLIEKTVDYQCFICKIHNPRKTTVVPRGLKPPSGLFGYLQLGFIQLPHSMGYQYVLVIVCMFSSWVEAFLCQKTDWQGQINFWKTCFLLGVHLPQSPVIEAPTSQGK